MPEGKQYLIVIQLLKVTPERLADTVPKIQETLQSMSTEPVEFAFKSATADLFGFGLRSKRNPHQILTMLESPSEGRPYTAEYKVKDPFIRKGDHIMILEIGEDINCGEGFTRFENWLQHH